MSIYFIRAQGKRAVKIGHAANPRRRLYSLQIGSSLPLSLVALLDGDRKEEADLHRRFASQRIRGEWFKPCREIENIIRANPVKEKVVDSLGNPPLASRRKALGLSQEQLAAILGINQATVSRNETAADPDKRYILSLDALAVRNAAGEDLAATSAQSEAA